MTIKFSLRTSKKGQPVPIRVRVRTKNNDAETRLDRYILPEQWSDKSGGPKPVNKELDPKGYEAYTELKGYLQEVHDNLFAYAQRCDTADEKITKAGLDSFLTLKKNQKKREQEKPRDIPGYWEWLTNQMKAGGFRKQNNNEVFDDSTIKVWRVTRNVYLNFEKNYRKVTGMPITWDSLDKNVMDAFVEYMENYGYMTKSINKYIITFKALIRYAYKDKIHRNLSCLDDLSRRSEKPGCTTAKTYLTDDELQALYDMPLDPGSLQDKVRDVFLVGCYTCQRVSDYSHFKRSNFGETKNGTKVIRLTQEKTDAAIVIPILSDNLQSILEKYDYNLPDLGESADVLINRYIKQILSDLAQSVPSLAEPVQTILTLPEKRAEEAGKMTFERDAEGNVIKPKYLTICTHSARRSGLTNLYKSHLFTTKQLMSISGHQTESHFFLYIRQSSDELAEEIAGILEKAKERKESNEELF